MKIGIFGSTGFVGNFLCKNLSYDIIPISRKEVDLLDYDQLFSFLKKNKLDVVINAAVNSDSNMDHFNLSSALHNLNIFHNLFRCRYEFGKLINFGSGAEFDRRYSITNATEEDIFLKLPEDHYGLSKNICSRTCTLTDNFFNLRLFGVFYSNEPARRLLPKVISNQPMLIDDKYFDYFYLKDILPVVDYYINNFPKYKDLNLVYKNKMLLSDFVYKFCLVKNLPTDNIKTSEKLGLNYTGSSSKFEELNFPTTDLNQAFENYQ
jgi:UDP-glucose 4-epimerase